MSFIKRMLDKSFPKSEPVLSGSWENHPKWMYAENLFFVRRNEILATVRQAKSLGQETSDLPWEAYIGGAACRSGSFTRKESAMACVEEDLKKRQATFG
jgi:hypothetical protein